MLMEFQATTQSNMNVDEELQRKAQQRNKTSRQYDVQYDEIMKQVTKMCNAHFQKDLTHDETLTSIVRCFKFELLRYLNGHKHSGTYVFLRDYSLQNKDYCNNIIEPIFIHAKDAILNITSNCGHNSFLSKFNLCSQC